MDDGGRGSHLQIFADHEILAKGFQALNMPAHLVEEKEKGRSKRSGQKEGVVQGEGKERGGEGYNIVQKFANTVGSPSGPFLSFPKPTFPLSSTPPCRS
jgi:hypothetical protein